ncbi:LIC20153 family lipoprotein [Leptospira meyeri]|uniref:LIC20153 family lipoprotein n=1 Tax=Leptospira meyeri TaxID=29508 RepID=UPI000C2B45A3|nr:hypothetical protein [Leptospira meyeri]PKA24539.1 hypothetical protein CH381_20165 [Leptospira sp. mixed culture ATI2-C-A1]MCW7488343.1 hypothetical protein [Leptospira meyeri]PJZ79856.1 hypothetical protein CH359_16395 [Leptospira meyeri]PJZ95388.1 hypothetical protein CH358_17870 [Leptospira meyeri]PKA11816.1 hypothetical protein CH372_12530 [Leptospira meyeri]
MKSFQNKTKLLIVLSLIAGFTFQCEKKKEDDNTATLIALAGLTSSAGDCSVSASGKATINTWTTDVTGTTAGTISKLGSVPIVGHTTAAIKLTSDAGTTLNVNGSAFIIVYKTSACPLTTSNIAATPANFSITGATDSNSEFPSSYKITNQTAAITFNGAQGAGDYYVFIYAIPRNGQSAAVNYTFAP